MEPIVRLIRPAVLFSIIVLTAQCGLADPPLDLQIGSANVELAATNPTAFRLTISYAGKPAAASSVYLAPTQNPASTAQITDGNWTGLKSPAGELLIDTANAQWTLRDPQGKTLIPPTPLGEFTHNIQTNKPFVILNLGCPSDKPFQ